MGDVGPDQVKALAKFDQGEKFKLNGLYYTVTENLGNGWVKVQDLKTGDTGKINADYKSTYLVLEKGYSETGAALVSADDYWKGETKLVGELPDQIAGQKLLLGQTIWEAVGWEDGKLNAKVVGMTHDMAEHELKQLGKTAALGGTQKATLLIEKPFGWKPAKVGDMLSIDGQKASVTKIWKSGVVQVKKSKGGVIKFDPSDPALGELYTPDDWVLGNKEKLKSLAPGDLFHGGTGVKQIHPYRVIGAEGTNVKVKNLETGDELVLSGEKSYTRLVSAFQPLPSEAVPEDHVTPVDPGSGFVPDAWEPGAPTTADVLKFGDKITYMGTPYEVVEVPEEGQLGGQMKNLLTGEVKPFAAKSTIPVTLLQPKGGLLGTTPETFNLAQWVKKPGAQELVGPGLVGPTPLKTLDVGDVVQMKSDNVYKITAKEHGKVFATLLAKPSGKGTKFDPGHEATLEPNAFGYVLQPKAGPVELPAPVGAPSVQPGEFDPNQWEEEGKAGPASKWLSTPGTLFRVVKSGNVFVVGDHGMVTLLKGKTGSHVEGDTWEFPTNLPAVKLAPKQPLAVALEGPTPDTFDPAQWTIKTGEQVTAASDAKWDKGGIYQYVATGTWLKVLGASADGAKVQVLTGSAIHPPGYEYTLVADAVLAKAVPIAQAAPKTLGAHTPEAAPGVTPKPTGLADADAGFKGDLGGWPSDWEEGEKVTFGDLAVGDVFHGDSNVAHVKLEAGMAVNLSAGNTHDAFVFESKVTVLRPKETAVTPTAQAVHTIVHTPQAAPGITPNPTTADAEEQWHSSSGKIPDDWHFGDVIDSKDLLPGDVFQGTKVGAPHLKVADHTFVNLSDGAAHAYAGLEGDVKLIVPNEVAPGVPPTLPGLSMLVTPEEHAAAHPTGTSFASKSWADLEVGDVYASYSTAKTALSNKGLWVVTGKGGGKVFSARLGEPGKTVDHLFSDSTAQVYSYGRLKPPEPTTAELWLANKDKWTLAKSVAKQAVKPFADFNAGDIVKAQHSGSVWVVKSKTKTGKVKIELLEVGPNAKAEEAPGKKMLLSPAVAKGLKGDLMVLKPEVPGPDVLDEPDEMQEPWQTVEWTQAAAAEGTPPPGWTKAEDTVGFGDLKPGDVFRSWGGTGMPISRAGSRRRWSTWVTASTTT